MHKRETLRGNPKNSHMPNLSVVYPFPQSGLYKRSGVTRLSASHMRFLRPVEIAVKEIPWIVSRPFAGFFNPAAAQFYANLAAGGYEAEELLKVLPRHRLIYVAVPKSASTRIRGTLAQVEGRHSRSLTSTGRSLIPRSLWTTQLHGRRVLSSGDGCGHVTIFLCAQSLRARGIVLERQVRQQAAGAG